VGKSSMPRTHGGPRYQSVQNINAKTPVMVNRLAAPAMALPAGFAPVSFN